MTGKVETLCERVMRLYTPLGEEVGGLFGYNSSGMSGMEQCYVNICIVWYSM